MTDQSSFYFTLETSLLPMQKEEIGEITARMKELLQIIEMVKPSRFITSTLRGCGLGQPMKNRDSTQNLRSEWSTPLSDPELFRWRSSGSLSISQKSLGQQQLPKLSDVIDRKSDIQQVTLGKFGIGTFAVDGAERLNEIIKIFLRQVGEI